MQEQRFLGEILARRGVVPLDRLEGLYAVQREKGTSLVDLITSGAISYEEALGVTARPKELVRSLEQRGVVAAATV